MAKLVRSFRKGATALQVLEGIDLAGKVAIVTGANAGIGFEATRALAIHNAHIIMACRSVKSAEEAREKIVAEKPEAKLEIMKLDMGELSSAEEFAKDFIAKNLPLHILLFNAGVYAPDPRVTNDGFEATFQVNYLTQFHLTNLLIAKLIESAPARIVIVSSKSHEMATFSVPDVTWEQLSPSADKMNSALDAYSNAKLCSVWFAKELDRRYRDRGILAASLHPGMIKTNLWRNASILGTIISLVAPFRAVRPDQGAATQVYLATAPELQPDQGGKYFEFCNEKEPTQKGLNAEAAKKMWAISEEMIQRYKSSDRATVK